MRLIFFDLDGTLVEESSSWETLHRHFGANRETVKKNRKEFSEGRVSYEEWMRKDIGLWMDKNPTLKEIRGVLASYTLSKNVRKACDVMRDDCRFFIVSSGIDLLAEMVAYDLRLDGFYANGLEEKKGVLTGEGVHRVNPSRKFDIVAEVCRKHGATRQEAVAVGDSLFDISLFCGCDFCIAYRPKDKKVEETSDVIMEDFSELPNIIMNLPKKIR